MQAFIPVDKSMLCTGGAYECILCTHYKPHVEKPECHERCYISGQKCQKEDPDAVLRK